MGIIKTYIENGRHIRIWSESRGSKTLTRKFYLRFRLCMVINGRLKSQLFDSLSIAEQKAEDFMKSLCNNWRLYDECCSHMNGKAWRCYNKGIVTKCYICQEGGEMISEIIK